MIYLPTSPQQCLLLRRKCTNVYNVHTTMKVNDVVVRNKKFVRLSVRCAFADRSDVSPKWSNFRFTTNYSHIWISMTRFVDRVKQLEAIHWIFGHPNFFYITTVEIRLIVTTLKNYDNVKIRWRPMCFSLSDFRRKAKCIRKKSGKHIFMYYD